MKIQDSNMQLKAETMDRTVTSHQRRQFYGDRTATFQSAISEAVKRQSVSHTSSMENAGSESYSGAPKQENSEISLSAESIGSITVTMSDKEYQRLTFLEMILSKITGKEIRFIVPGSIRVNEGKYSSFVQRIISKPAVMSYQESYHYERTSEFEFTAEGSVTTEDGRNIQFDFTMKTSRQTSFTSVSEGIVNMTDPLVLSFDGNLPQLSDEKYSFDLDNDGTSDQISFLTGNSGFLALDKNGDGIINNGGELFGTGSGSGFKDLAEYDLDGNGWIDESDSIFDGLRIWMKDRQGNDRLLALGQKGIGAIYLGSAAAEFDVLDSAGKKEGIIRETGVYLNENGNVGNIHHLDIRR